MKALLILLNLVLCVLLVWGGVNFFRHLRSTTSEAGFTVKKRIPGTEKTSKTSKTGKGKKTTSPLDSAAPKTDAAVPLSTQVDAIVKANIFNQERCPNSSTFGSSRVELTLVGTFKIGNISGAIILQKTQTRNQPFMPFGMNPNPMGFQQRQMGINQRGTNRNTGSSRTQGTVNTRRQSGRTRNTQSTRGMTNATSQGTSSTGTTTTAEKTYKQYVRLGETLSNGYKLVEVDRARVVLTRGSDKLELELADASQNAPKTSGPRRSATQTQVMQQMLNSMQRMQQMQMMQGFQMMRMGQESRQRGTQSNGRSNSGPPGRR